MKDLLYLRQISQFISFSHSIETNIYSNLKLAHRLVLDTHM